MPAQLANMTDDHRKTRKSACKFSSSLLAAMIVGAGIILAVLIVINGCQANISMRVPSHANAVQEIKTPKPVIGILTEVFRDYKRFYPDKHLHIAASYVKWIESAGAQVVPVLLNQNDSYYERIFNETNGLLFPGGDNLLDPHKDTPMMVAAKKLYQLALEANNQGDFYPIWGTCLGLELLSVLSANRNVLQNCQATDATLTMEFVARGRLFAPNDNAGLPLNVDYAELMMKALANQTLTYNYHRKCLTDEGLAKANLSGFYKPLAYSTDSNGLRFIAIFEAIKYPFYGVQFHPEKPPFEFVTNLHQKNIPHSRAAIAVSRYFADFFVRSAQLNGHRPESKLDIQSKLIYATQPIYLAPRGDMYEQRYLFPYHDNGLSTEEFLNHAPRESEVIPEDVDDD